MGKNVIVIGLGEAGTQAVALAAKRRTCADGEPPVAWFRRRKISLLVSYLTIDYGNGEAGIPHFSLPASMKSSLTYEGYTHEERLAADAGQPFSAFGRRGAYLAFVNLLLQSNVKESLKSLLTLCDSKESLSIYILTSLGSAVGTALAAPLAAYLQRLSQQYRGCFCDLTVLAACPKPFSREYSAAEREECATAYAAMQEWNDAYLSCKGVEGAPDMSLPFPSSLGGTLSLSVMGDDTCFSRHPIAAVLLIEYVYGVSVTEMFAENLLVCLINDTPNNLVGRSREEEEVCFAKQPCPLFILTQYLWVSFPAEEAACYMQRCVLREAVGRLLFATRGDEELTELETLYAALGTETESLPSSLLRSARKHFLEPEEIAAVCADFLKQPLAEDAVKTAVRVLEEQRAKGKDFSSAVARASAAVSASITREAVRSLGSRLLFSRWREGVRQMDPTDPTVFDYIENRIKHLIRHIGGSQSSWAIDEQTVALFNETAERFAAIEDLNTFFQYFRLEFLRSEYELTPPVPQDERYIGNQARSWHFPCNFGVLYKHGEEGSWEACAESILQEGRALYLCEKWTGCLHRLADSPITPPEYG